MNTIPRANKFASDNETLSRRAAGIVLGAGLGLIYALVGGMVSRLVMPGLPLYQPPFGFLGNVLLAMLWGAAVGLICAWPENTIAGVLVAALVSIAPAVVRGLGSVPEDRARLGLAALVLGIPAALFMVPATAVLRATVNHLASFGGSRLSWQERWRRPLLLGLFMAVIALFSLPPAPARATLKHMQATLQTGLAAKSTADLPQELRTVRSGDFLTQADDRYTLEWTEVDLDRFIELRPANNYNEHSAVLVRFDNGHTLVCLYPTPQSRPNCDFRE